MWRVSKATRCAYSSAPLQQLDGSALDIVIDVNVSLRCLNALMTRQRCENANANAAFRKSGDKGAPTAVTAGALDACGLVEPAKELRQRVWREPALPLLLRWEQCALWIKRLGGGKVRSQLTP